MAPFFKEMCVAEASCKIYKVSDTETEISNGSEAFFFFFSKLNVLFNKSDDNN